MKILVSALEPSANLHLEHILKELKGCEICGIFDKSFGNPIFPSSDFSVMGFLDVLPKILKAKKAISQMVEISKGCDKVLLIDSPAFNLPLSKAIKKENPNIKIIYYILPQVWAWKPKRVEKVEKQCDVLCSILPFDNKFYHKSIYVGNPLLDELNGLREEAGGLKNFKAVSFLPGSRKSEIKSLMDIYRQTAKKIDNCKKYLIIPKSFDDKKIDEFYGDISDFEVLRDTASGLLKSDFAFICSGTATLEAALYGVPFVLVYRAKKIDYLIAKTFVKLKYVGLANIILDFFDKEPLHQELLQEEVNVQNLLKAYEQRESEKFLFKAKLLREILQNGSAKNMAKIIEG